MLASGILVHNRYRLNNLLGKGSTGEVWSALDDISNKTIAIKFVTFFMINSLDLRPPNIREGKEDFKTDF